MHGAGACRTLSFMIVRIRRSVVRLLVLTVAAMVMMPVAAQVTGKGQDACSSTDSLTWMIGSWRLETQGTIFIERWRKGEGGMLVGEARSMKADGSEVYQDEVMRIAPQDGHLVYAADPDGDGVFVEFTLVACDVRSAVFENPKHDFPKRLSYHRTDDGGLTASVTDLEDKGFELEFRPDPEGGAG
jgi:hypothetical protein